MDPTEELAIQLSIQNRITLARELYKLQYYDSDDYIDILKDIEDDLIGR